MCVDRNVVPVIIIPPVTTIANQRILSRPEKYGYVFRFQEYVKSLPFETYDFHDIRNAGSTDCECIDGFHIGDVAYQRILLNILRTNPATAIRTFVNAGVMEKMVVEGNGRVMTVFEEDKGKFNYRETDFLQLGCKKD
jgi:hypothetical protein